MTTLRFEFQKETVESALCDLDFGPDEQHGRIVINCGCNTDPAHLKAIDPVRVVNCDLDEYDQVLGQPNLVDVTFDAARDRWPFDDDQAELVVLGDILEHLKPDEILFALVEARRVAARLCVTVPEDDRPETNDQRADEYPRGAVHRTVVTRGLLEPLLERAHWTVVEWRVVEYDSGVFWGKRVMGHFILAD